LKIYFANGEQAFYSSPRGIAHAKSKKSAKRRTSNLEGTKNPAGEKAGKKGTEEAEKKPASEKKTEPKGPPPPFPKTPKKKSAKANKPKRPRGLALLGENPTFSHDSGRKKNFFSLIEKRSDYQ